MPIRDEAINVFMGLPGDGARLELTYNHGVDTYELGTGYNHIAVTVDDLDAHARESSPSRASSPRSRRTRVREGGSRLCFVRDPDGYRIELIERRAEPVAGGRSATAVIDLGSNSFRLVVFSVGTDGWWKRTDEIHEAVRIGAGLDETGELGEERDGSARCATSSSSRTSAGRATSAGDVADGRDERDPRRANRGFLAARERDGASRSACSRPRRRRTTATSQR